MCGRLIGLENQDGVCAPLGWKSKTIQQVCKSVKTAETRSLEKGMEDSFYLARIIKEIYSEAVSTNQILVQIYIDSKTLLGHSEQYNTDMWEDYPASQISITEIEADILLEELTDRGYP